MCHAFGYEKKGSILGTSVFTPAPALSPLDLAKQAASKRVVLCFQPDNMAFLLSEHLMSSCDCVAIIPLHLARPVCPSYRQGLFLVAACPIELSVACVSYPLRGFGINELFRYIASGLGLCEHTQGGHTKPAVRRCEPTDGESLSRH